MTPEQRQRIRKRYQRFRALPNDEKQRIRQQRKWFKNLPQEKRKNLQQRRESKRLQRRERLQR